jgi:Ion channel
MPALDSESEAGTMSTASPDRSDRPRRRKRRLLLGFLLLYLGVIFGFAWIYSKLPGEFFHATVEHEPWMATQREDIRAGIREALIRNYMATHDGKDALTGKGWTAKIDRIEIEEPTYENNSFHFNIHLSVQGEGVPKWYFFMLPLDMEVHFSRRAAVKKSEDKAETAYVFVSINPKDSAGELDELIQTKGRDNKIQINVVPILNELNDQMVANADSMKGFPGRAAGNFPRMVYLSTVTITTLGFGDIVPITDRARWWVVGEAILGTVIMGLFLWAITS